MRPLTTTVTVDAGRAERSWDRTRSTIVCGTITDCSQLDVAGILLSTEVDAIDINQTLVRLLANTERHREEAATFARYAQPDRSQEHAGRGALRRRGRAATCFYTRSPPVTSDVAGSQPRWSRAGVAGILASRRAMEWCGGRPGEGLATSDQAKLASSTMGRDGMPPHITPRSLLVPPRQHAPPTRARQGHPPAPPRRQAPHALRGARARYALSRRG